MVVARQEWLDWEFDPPDFARYGCDDIGDLLASGQMSVEFLDDDDYEPTEAQLEEARLFEDDFREIRAELEQTVGYLDGETEVQYEARIDRTVSLRAHSRKYAREVERKKQGLPYVPNLPDVF
jgi:hypothetical protein